MKEIIQQVLDGHKNALEVFIDFKRSEKEIKNALSKIKDLAIEEADNYNDKSFAAFGATITKKGGGGKWDYSHLDWFKDYENKKKGSVEAAKSSNTIVDSDGVVVDGAIFKPNKDTINVEF